MYKGLPYQTFKEIGKGQHSVVFSAMVQGHKVAIKVVPYTNSDGKKKEMIENEILILQTLR
jgi:predicted Ser/Thr protein kinase